MRLGMVVYACPVWLKLWFAGIPFSEPQPPPSPLDFLKRVQSFGLEGAQLEGNSLIKMSPEEREVLKEWARERQFYLEIATGGTEPTALISQIQMAHSLGVQIVRTVIGGAKIGGDRRGWEGKWPSFLREVINRLKQVMPVASDLGVYLCLENHQDLTTQEFLWILEEVDSPYLALCLDTANPLAVVEDPVETAHIVAPFTRTVHLKDYQVVESEEGYRLIRCALGEGVIDLPEIVKILTQKSPAPHVNIEIGAFQARHIRVLEPDFWPCYPSIPASQLAKVLRCARRKGMDPRRDWRTPAEKGASYEELLAYENQQLERSVQYAKQLFLSLKQDF